jgi:large subunit ribosomal protein L4
VSIIEAFELQGPKTRDVTRLLTKIGLDSRKVLILTNGVNRDLFLSVRNLPDVRVLPYREASAYDVLASTELLIEEEALSAAGVTDNE